MLQIIKSIISAQTGMDIDKITAQSCLKENLGIDSLDAIRLLMTLEKQFGIKISSKDDAILASPKMTVQGIADYVSKRTNEFNKGSNE